jgi:type II secretory pathway component PulF
MAWHFPWPATLYRHHIRGTFCGVLSRNLAAGLEVTAAVRGAAASTSDERCQESGEKVVQAIARGSELVPALLATGLARPTEGLVLRAGERSGELVDSLREVAERYAEFRTRGLKTLMVVLGALLTIVVVVWVVLGVLESYSGILGGGDDLLERIDREAFPG